MWRLWALWGLVRWLGSDARSYRREVKRWHGLLDTLDPKTGEIRE